MKILFPFVGDSVGGSHISAIELIKELKNTGTNVLIVLHVKNGPLAYFLKKQELSYSFVPAQKLAGEKPSILHILNDKCGLLLKLFTLFLETFLLEVRNKHARLFSF